MHISLSVWSTHTYFREGHWSHVDFIEFVGDRTKAEGVELLTNFWKPEELPAVKEALARHELKVACVGASNNFAHADAAKRQDQVGEIVKALDIASELDARVVRVFSADRPAEGTSYEQVKAWIIEGLREAAAAAEAKGIVLCLENHGIFAGKAEQVRDILDAVGSPFLRSTFDTGNFLLVDSEPGEALTVLQPYVAHVHFKDFVRVGEEHNGQVYKSLSGGRFAGKIAGEGSIDLQSLLQRLKAAGYAGWLTVEFEGDDEQTTGSIGSIDNLDRILQTLQ